MLIHCIGYGSKKRDQSGKAVRTIYYAKNRREIAQQCHIARKHGDRIEYWYAQTGTGARLLGNNATKTEDIATKTEDIPLPKMVICPICDGDGENGGYFCPVCNGSGITTPGYENNWKEWQIMEMKKRRKEKQKL